MFWPDTSADESGERTQNWILISGFALSFLALRSFISRNKAVRSHCWMLCLSREAAEFCVTQRGERAQYHCTFLQSLAVWWREQNFPGRAALEIIFLAVPQFPLIIPLHVLFPSDAQGMMVLLISPPFHGAVSWTMFERVTSNQWWMFVNELGCVARRG